MGSGIAQAAAMSGFDTVVRDVSQPLLERGRAGILKSLGRMVERGKLTGEARDAALSRLRFVTDLQQLGDRDIVVEAVTEDLDLKNGLWRELDSTCPARTIFASNTSSLTIASMAGATSRPDRFVGLHFFNPVPMMPLVEVVRSAELGCGHPMGPLSLMDFIGLDTVVRIADIMVDAYGEDRYQAPALLRRMVIEGSHGRKSGKGFYDYSTDPPVPVVLS
ncbi:MAG: hbdA [Geminicoccaceae bacterium]|nr:hbdA [Geminicoccaceae bacterium]